MPSHIESCPTCVFAYVTLNFLSFEVTVFFHQQLPADPFLLAWLSPFSNPLVLQTILLDNRKFGNEIAKAIIDRNAFISHWW